MGSKLLGAGSFVMMFSNQELLRLSARTHLRFKLSPTDVPVDSASGTNT
jgi:hypothetical protein